MPRERITSTTQPRGDLIVTWSRDSIVQIATTVNDADERLRAWTEATTGGTDQPVPTAPGTSFRTFDGWHINLDRAGLNQLIRVLRAARDQAFGKDE